MSPQQSIAHYRIVSKLGEGGMGAVYRATDTKLNRDVAIKVLPESFAADPDRLGRFTREAQVLASLNHPNIAAIYGVEDRALVMELVDGETLRGPLPVSQVLAIVHQLIDALEYAHEKGIVHRDLKPDNIKVTPDGRVKVLDFGLAKAMAEGRGPTAAETMTLGATLAGVILGTAAYMAPEQARGTPTDRRADIFSFGAVLYELLTGRQAFPGESVTDILASVVKTDPDWSVLPKDTAAGLRRLLRLCLVKDRKQRLQAIGDARIFLDAQQEPLDPAAPRSRPYLAWTVAAAAALGLASLAVVHFREATPVTAATAFAVPPPEGTSYHGHLAVSPDGRSVAAIVMDAAGSTAVWIRDLASLSSRRIPGTEGARSVFWQPEGRWIAFQTLTHVKKVEATGGVPVTRALMSSSPRGGTWQGGTILYTGQADPVYRVSAAGGDAQPLTSVDPSRRETEHNGPQFLPDGKHFLCLIRSLNPEHQGVFVMSLGDPGRRTRVLPDTMRTYYDSGHLLFVRGGNLMAQRFDPDRAALLGEAYPLTSKIGYAAYVGVPALGVSGQGVIAWAQRLVSDATSKMVWFDRSGRQQGEAGPARTYTSAALSPDRRWIAAAELGESARVLMIDAERRTVSPLEAISLAAVWSPDGSRIAQSVLLGGDQAIQSIDPFRSGHATEIVKRSHGRKVPYDWSINGNLLYGVNEGGRGALWTVPVAGGKDPVRLAELQSQWTFARFSPDARWFAYADERGGVPQIFVESNPPGRGLRQISTDGGTDPRWRRDGRELFYIDPRGRMMSVEVKPGESFDAGAPKELFTFRSMNNAYTTTHYDVTGDGQRFLILTPLESMPSDPMNVVQNWTRGFKP